MKILYTLHDVKAGSFCAPFVAENDAVVRRDLAPVVARGDSMISRYPADFVVYALGEFDAPTGRLVAYDKPMYRFGCGELCPAGDDRVSAAPAQPVAAEDGGDHE